MRILPLISQFNPQRAFYEIGPTSFYVKAGQGMVNVTKKGVIVIENAKGLGLSTKGNDFAQKQRILIKDSAVACIYKRPKDFIVFDNCTFPVSSPKTPKYDPKMIITTFVPKK